MEYLKTRDYKMKILHDQGLFRSLEFKHNDSANGHFVITTWPGHLCISGDMGTFVFTQTLDMVNFFSGDDINPGYWSQKVQAESVFGGGVSSFSIDSFKAMMLETKEEHQAEQPFQHIKNAEIDEAFSGLEYCYDEHDAIDFIRKLDLPGFDATDFGWPDEHNFHYLFACYAINFACNNYLETKAHLAA